MLFGWPPSFWSVELFAAELPYEKVYKTRSKNRRLGLGLDGSPRVAHPARLQV